MSIPPLAGLLELTTSIDAGHQDELRNLRSDASVPRRARLSNVGGSVEADSRVRV